MSVSDLPSDIVILICNEALNKDNTNTEINKFKKATLDMIAEKQLTISSEICYYQEGFDPDIAKDCEAIELFIDDYIKALSDTQKNTIICDYGILNAVKLYHDYLSIGTGSDCEEICATLSNNKYNRYVINEIILLIINDEIGFHCDWHNNK